MRLICHPMLNELWKFLFSVQTADVMMRIM